MKYIYLFIIVVLSFCISGLNAQTDFTNIQSIVPPSPEAASLGQFGDIPLNSYTGQTAINLPIHNVSVDGMALPISLSYQGNAIRVRDEASRVGLGWSLNAGGVVTRVMRGGMPDDIIDWVPYDGAPGCIRGKLHGGDSDLPEPDFVDTEHDMFYFNFLGYNGKFIFKNQNKVVFFPHTNLKVDVDWEHISQPGICDYDQIENIHITTPDGIKYSFTESEGTIYHTFFSRSYYYKSSWYLTQINHPNGQSIDLTYKYIGLNGAPIDWSKEDIIGSSNTVCNCRADGIASASQTSHDIKRIDRIIYTNGEIVFDGTSREDFIPGETIDNIKIYNEGALVKEYQLNQSYFNSPGGNTEEYKRLKLNNVAEIGGTEKITLYDFNYNESVSLPHKLSNEIDVWGFYNANGAPGSYTQGNYDDLFPTIYFYPDDPEGDRFSVFPRQNFEGVEIIYDGYDRTSNGAAMRAGMLKKVIYPTGGYTEFSYEMHEFNYKGNVINGGGLRLQSISDNAINGPGISKTFQYLKKDGTTTSGAVTGVPQHAYMCSKPNEEDVNGCVNVQLTYDVVINPGKEGEPGTWQTRASFEILGYNDDDIDHVIMNGQTFYASEGFIWVNGGDYPLDPIGPPTYDFVFEAHFVTGCTVSTSVTISLGGQETLSLCDEEGSCVSSDAFNIVRLMNDQNKLGSHSGSFIGYSRVEETIAGFGKVVYEYSNPETNPDIPPQYTWEGGQDTQECIDEYLSFYNDYDVYPFSKGTSRDFERGLLEKKLVFEEGQSPIPVQSEIYSYEIHNVDQIDESNMIKFGRKSLNIPFSKGGSWQLESKIVLLSKIDSELDFVTTTTNFDYSIFTYTDGYVKFNKSSESVTNSNGEVFGSSYLYANDLNDALTLNKYMIGIPLETVTPQGGSKIEYSQTGNGVLPYKFYTQGFQPNICNSAQFGNWRLVGTIDQYDGINPSIINNPCENNNIILTWNNNKLQSHQHIGQQTTFTYNSLGQVETITDPNEQVSIFLYDDFERLEQRQSRGGSIIEDFTYNLGLIIGGENFVETTTTMDVNVPTTRNYIDGLGKAYSTILEGYTYGNNDLTISTSYDGLGRVLTQSDPRNGAAWISEFKPSLVGQKALETSAGWPRDISYQYFREMYNGGEYFRTTINDENENITQLLIDKVGRTKLERKFLNGSSIETVFEYNQRGDITSITQPNGELFSNSYFPDGKLNSETIPGKGTIAYEYNDRDLLWRIQDNGTIENTYNEYGQIEIVMLNGEIISDIDYYSYSANAGSRGQISLREDKVLGSTETVRRTYTYDSYGRILTSNYHHLLGLDAFTFTYNDRDQILTSTRVTHEGKNINYVYTYDHGGRITEIEMTIDGVSETVSIMEYNERDWLVNDNIGVDAVTNIALTEIGYEYNGRGWIRKINEIGDCNILPNPQQPVPSPGNEIKFTHDSGNINVYYDANALATGAPSSIAIVSEMSMYNGDTLIYTVLDTLIIPKGSYGFEAPYNNEQLYQLQGAFDLSATGTLIATDIISEVQNINNDISSTALIDENYFKNEVNDRIRTVPRLGDGGCIGDALFAEEINYLNGATPQYNGNISSVKWRALNKSYIPLYRFTYDNLDRMLTANYAEKNLLTNNWTNQGRYNASFTYDVMGNIESLNRFGLIDGSGPNPEFNMIDNLTFVHNGSRLQSVTETGHIEKGFKSNGGSYGYDGRGNVTSAPGVSNISYNAYNLPESIALENGGTFTNFYDATGAKVKKVVTPPSANPNNDLPYTLHYIDEIEYKNQTIESIQHEKGRVIFENNVALHEYVIKDHAGSGRVYFLDRNDDGLISTNPGDGEVSQEQHYYPFGMAMEGVDFVNPLDPVSKKRYTGMEHQNDNDFGWYDYGARFMDPSIGRFMQVDPLATVTPSFNPYAYALNNPIRFTDPDGMLASEVNDFASVTIYGIGGNPFSIGSSKAGNNAKREASVEDDDGTGRHGTFIIQHKRKKGENRKKIAKKYGVKRKHVGITKGTSRGALIPVLDVKKLERVIGKVKSLNVEYAGPQGGEIRPVSGDQTTYGAFVVQVASTLIEKGLYHSENPDGGGLELSIANGDFVPIGLSDANFDGGRKNFEASGFELRAAIWDIDVSINRPTGRGGSVNVPLGSPGRNVAEHVYRDYLTPYLRLQFIYSNF